MVKVENTNNRSETFLSITWHPVYDNCGIWTVPSDSERLTVAHIFACSHFGYDIRIKTETKYKDA
ncbi:hypothetical protein SDC9_177772 [bioreactor metagenome]|uniref:Uncharacterized protein n=1 Tax=bioreactor metagenome TaxID=1076179 RepID=A0A645GTZ6_9ZZZZ